MRYEFQTAAQIVFGAGTIQEAGKLAKQWGRKAIVVTGSNGRRAERLMEVLAEAHIAVRTLAVASEPDTEVVSRGAQLARDFGAEMVIGIGGGSVIDAAKAVAGLVRNEEPIETYLEVVGKGMPLCLPPLPWMAIPTTAGTGAEATKNAVLSVPSHKVKVSLRSPLLYPTIALIDPELALGTPAAITAATGMDALCQLIEAYVCSRANPHTDALCAAGIPLVASALPVAFAQPNDLAARTAMAQGALWSGMALANAGLGAAHGFAAPLGGILGAPHGAICGALLAPVTRANVAGLCRAGNDTSRFRHVASWVTGRADANEEEGVAALAALADQLKIPGLARHGLTATLVPEICARAKQASSMKANPVFLSDDELTTILREAS